MANIIKKVVGAVKGDKKQESEAILNARLDRYRQVATNSRREEDWKWFNYDLFVAGNHNAKYDKSTQQIAPASKSESSTLLTINKTYSTLRGVRSYVLQNRPKAEVTPYNMTEADVDQAVQLNQLLDYVHDRLGFRQKLRASMLHALKYSVGFWQILWDEDADDGKGEVKINVIDPYDLYWDPSARVPAEARFVILSVRRSLDDLKEDSMYKDANWDEIAPDGKLASSSFKSRLMQFEKGSQQGSDDKEGTVIVDEYWYKEKHDEKQEDGSVRPGHKIMLCTRIGDTVIRKPFDTELTRFPFFRLCSDIEPLSMYGTGWVKNLMPINKALNVLESSVLNYNIVVNKAQLIADKGAGIRYLTNKHGDVIEKKKGFDLTPRPIPPLSNVIENQIVNMNRYIEDIGCLHDASMGRQSSPDQSGRAIESLQEGDSNNLSELTENTEEFLEDVYEYTLELMSQKYQFVRNVATTSSTGERLFMQFIGEQAQPELQSQGATKVPAKNIVDVKIASYLAYSAQGRREAMKDLVSFPQMANLPPDVILQAYQIGPIADIIQKIKQQEQQQQQQQAQQQQQEAQIQGQQQQQQTAQKAQIQQQQAQQEQAQQQQQVQQGQAGMPEAIAFIRSILSGQMPELPKSIGPDFIKYLDHFMQSPEAKSNGTLLSILQQVRDQAQLRTADNSATVN